MHVLTHTQAQDERIHGGGPPVSHAHQQEDKGDQWVEQRGHHVADGSAEQNANSHLERSLDW